MRQPVQARIPGLAGRHALRLTWVLGLHMEGGEACWCSVRCSESAHPVIARVSTHVVLSPTDMHEAAADVNFTAA